MIELTAALIAPLHTMDLTPKLPGLIGFKPHQSLGMIEGNSLDPRKPTIIVDELSMARSQELEQDFEWRYTQMAKHSSEQPGKHARWRTPTN